MITSPRNPKIAATAKLHRARERQRRGVTLLEGPHLLEAALKAGAVVQAVFALADDETTATRAAAAGLHVETVSPAALSRLATTEHPRGPVAVLKVPSPSPLQRADTVVLAGIVDPGNAGTLVRSAAAFGFRVAITRGSTDVWSPKVLRAGAGAHFATELSQLGPEGLDSLRAAGLQVVAAVPQGGVDIHAIGGEPVALLIGNEPRGLAQSLIDGADLLVTVPTAAGVESLNAAVAGSILMHAIRSRRRSA